MFVMPPEQQARVNIDKLLEQAGWEVQDAGAINLYAAGGVAVREFPLKSGHSIADYLLYTNQNAVGVIDILETLALRPSTLGVIFRKAQNKIQEPAMLTRLVRELNTSENWLSLSADVKGDAYESLLERNAQDVKTGAGQYFTPRPLDSGHRERHAPGAGHQHLRPRLRHRRLPAGGSRLHSQP